jgi:hypothetical protein
MSKENWYDPKTSKAGVFKIKNGKAVLEAKVQKKEYDRVSRSWRVTEETKEDIDVKELGFKKEIKGFVVFMREAMSPQTLKMYKGYFKQDIRIAIPRRKKLKFSYLYVSTAQGNIRGTNPLHIRHFAHNITTSLSMQDVEDNEITFEKLGKPKRISEATKRKLILQDDFLGLYKDEGLTKELIEL